MEQDVTEKKITTVDEYIRHNRPEVKEILIEFRDIIRKAAPEATEIISYGMPTYKQNGIVAHFAAFKNHCSIFLAPRYLDNFRESLKYSSTRSCVHFPLDEPLPKTLITKMVKYAVEKNELKAAAKTK